MFQGKEDLIFSVYKTGLVLPPDMDKMTIGEAAVLRFVKSVPKGSTFFRQVLYIS